MVSKVPKVAVVTRTKDRPVLLERAIQSVHSQTMKDFIHVIYNDGGDASSVDALVEKYKHIIDGRIKVVHNTTSKGLVSALNAGVRSANSTYVAIHDDDDSWDKDFLKKTTEHLDTTGAYGVITVVDIVEEKIEGNSVIEIKRGRGLEPVRGVVSIYDQCLNNYATPITFNIR
jgi:glycosyltransferase involved in cell wall biosynthesis